MESSFASTARRVHRHASLTRVALLLLIAVLPRVIGSQGARSTGTVNGVVTDSSGAAIAGAHVTVDGAGKPVVTDERGSFRIADVPGGDHRLVTRRVGFSPDTTSLTVRAGEPVSVIVRMHPVLQTLATAIVVAERPQYPSRLQGFYDRRERVTGHFFTAADIDRLGARVVTDLLRTLPAVWIGRRGRESNAITFRGASCSPMVYLDGAPAAAGYLDPDLISTRSLAGVEVYTSSSRVPQEFIAAQGKSGCGAIALWTRQDPLRTPRTTVTAAELAELIESNRLQTAQSVRSPATADPATPLRPTYPDSLFRARVGGRVVAEFVVDPFGALEVNTLSIVQATHPQFADAVRQALRTTRFVPAMGSSGRVRQLVQLPFVFVPPTSPP